VLIPGTHVFVQFLLMTHNNRARLTANLCRWGPFVMDSKLTDKAGSTLSGTNSHVEAILQKAHEELCDLLRQRLEVTRRIGSVKQTIVGLIKLFGDGVVADELRVEHRVYRRGEGVTDSCRRVLMEASEPMSSRRVCDLIQQTAPGVLANHKDPLATVNTVLGRLVQYGEARAVTSEQGHRVWQWSAENGSQESPT
jgi:hypothetical protein